MPPTMSTSRQPATPLRQSGFTLIELMIGLALIAILLAIGVPSLREAYMNVRITGQTNDFMSALQLARSEAVKQNVGVFVCASTNQTDCNASDWARGWIVFADTDGDGTKDADELAIKSRGALEGNNTMLSSAVVAPASAFFLPYRPTGVSSAAIRNFVICDSRTTPNTGRQIEINVTGRAQATRVTCPLTP